MLKFSWIVLCFIIAAGSRLRCHHQRDWALLTAGMAFTLAADFFLVLHDNRPVGVAVFCFVHGVYFYRAAPRRYGWIPPVIILASSPWFAVLDSLDATAILYASLFAADIAATALHYRRGQNGLPRLNRALMLAGVLLFALCDINVLLFNLPSYLPVPIGLSRAGYALIWVFYAPAQLILAVSAFRFPRRLGGSTE